MNVYEFASMADLKSFETGSAGTHWLLSMADYVADYKAEILDADYVDDLVWTMADTSVPTYERDMWQVFVDLHAWQVDISEYGCATDSIDKQARIALYVIAESILYQLVYLLREDS